MNFDTMRNINRILQCIKDYKGFKTNTALAEFLGVKNTALSNWIARGTLDEALIMAKIPEVRAEFLRTGELPMTEQDDLINALLRRIEVLEKKIEQMEKQL